MKRCRSRKAGVDFRVGQRACRPLTGGPFKGIEIFPSKHVLGYFVRRILVGMGFLQSVSCIIPILTPETTNAVGKNDQSLTQEFLGRVTVGRLATGATSASPVQRANTLIMKPIRENIKPADLGYRTINCSYTNHTNQTSVREKPTLLSPLTPPPSTLLSCLRIVP